MATRTYNSPDSFKQALESQLRKRTNIGDAGATSLQGQKLNRWRQQLIFERFQLRLQSEFGDAVTLKGGLALLTRLEGARTTKDLDVHIFGAPDTLLERLQRAGQRAEEHGEDWMFFTVEKKSDLLLQGARTASWDSTTRRWS